MRLPLYRRSVAVCVLLFFCAIPLHLFAQADFTASVSSGCSPLVVTFNAVAPGATSYTWDFGNGNFSSLADPGATFLNGGQYTVTLTVVYGSGGTETVTKPAFINVFSPPQPDFSANIFNICSGEPIAFTDLSQPGSGPITSWQWDFGDGTFSSLQNPVHNFQFPGTFAVTLVTTDANGCSTTEIKNGYIVVNQTPNADFSANNALGCTAPLVVNFLSVNNPPGVVHSWDFGVPGGTSASINPTFTYNNNGAYTVSHIVSDAIGCSDTSVITNYINVGQSTVAIQASQNVICPGQTVVFNCGAGPSAITNWNFGVGGATGSGCATSFTYTTPGTYVVTANITQLNGCVLNASTTIFVSTPPVVNFTTMDTLLCNPAFEVAFSNSTTGAVAYQWSFGDGGSSTAANPTHTYPVLPVFTATGQPYYYDVTLVATNSAGCSTTLTQPDYIVTGQTVADFIAIPENGCAPLNVAFLDVSLSPSPIIDWEWDFGNGNSVSGVQSPFETYTDTGSWDVQLIVTTLHGCKDTLLLPDFIQAGDTPVADFLIDTLTCASDPVQLTNLSQGADSYFWDFDDGTSGAGFEPNHAFQDTGLLDIMLIAFDRGCPDTMIQTAAIFVQAPFADFFALPSIICDLPADVSILDFTLGADHYEWDFGDNSPLDTTASPMHTYTQEGGFVISLFVSNDETGCVDSMELLVQIQLVEADFVVDTIFGCRPLTVQFTDSSYNPLQWRWDFGDGSPPVFAANPTHTYADTGRFAVRLQVSNSLSCTDDTLVSPLISVYQPQPDFTVPDRTGCAPFTVDFDNLTASLAPVVTWQWNLGIPGTTSSLFEPTFTYGPGVYAVSLTATDSIGCVNSISKPNYIQVTEPVADFFANYPINCPNNQLLFTSTSLGFGLSYAWDFGDGTTSIAQNPAKTYPNAGVYTVSLTVTDVLGCTSTLTRTAYITIATPQITLLADTTSSDCPPLLVNFTGVAVSPHNFTSWQWTFGDGGTSILQNPSHIYGAPGIYDLDISGADSSGCAASFSSPGLISVGGPTGSFTFGPQAACPGVPIQFTATGTNVAIYQWDVGGGFLPIGQQITHIYQTPGLYNPALIIEDSAGCQVVVPGTNTLEIYQPPIVNFNNNPALLCDSGLVSFTDLSLASASSSLATWEWDFGDLSGTSLQQNPTHVYDNPGTYNVQLIVSSSQGCADTLLEVAAVEVVASPTVLIGASDTSGCAPFLVQFTDLSPASNSAIANWQWDFSGAGSTLQNPLQVFPTANTYPVTLTLTDIYGCTGRDSTTINVFPVPQADFTGDDLSGCAPHPVQFTPLTPNAVDWRWDFGDNSPPVFAEDPLHIYTADGTYDVKLRVWDVNGCTDSLTRIAYVVLDHPNANFAVSDTIICPGETLTFTDLSQGIVPLSTWLWDFGNGLGTSTVQNPTYTYPPVAGAFGVSLTIVDANGCRDTLIRQELIEVRPDVVPPSVEVKAVTVAGPNRIQLTFDPYANALGDFGRYVLYRADALGNWIEVASSTQLNLSQFNDATVQAEQESYCYRLVVENFCGTQSPLGEAETHCSMLLTTQPLIDEIAVNWTPYVGWAGVAEYRVFRVVSYSPATAQLVATLPGTQTSWVDTDIFCYEGHTYRVQALQSGTDQLSWSNIGQEDPIHLPPSGTLHLSLATVEADSFVQISWGAIPAGDRQSEIIVEKSAGGAFVELLRQAVADPTQSYDDFAVSVDVQPYQYRAWVLDSCGDRTLAGRIASSIHLQARREQGLVYLNWTPYEAWESGVARYILEAFNESTQQFEQVAIIPADSLAFVDRATEWEQGQYCYHLLAEEAGGNQQVSLSNETCVVVEPLLYYPSAFTPNGDAVNDRFVIPGVFVESFQLDIFNRWGIKIFSTDNIDEGWDGTYNGASVPEGVYTYVVSGIGFSGQLIERAGTITVIR